MELKLEQSALTSLAVGPPACSTSAPGPLGLLCLWFPHKRPAFPNSSLLWAAVWGPSSLSVWEAPWVLLMCMALEVTFCGSSDLSHPPPARAHCQHRPSRTEPGSVGKENPHVVMFQSDSVSSGERQLLADYFMVSFQSSLSFVCLC